MNFRERDTYAQYVYKYSQMHAVDMGMDTQSGIYAYITHV